MDPYTGSMVLSSKCIWTSSVLWKGDRDTWKLFQWVSALCWFSPCSQCVGVTLLSMSYLGDVASGTYPGSLLNQSFLLESDGILTQVSLLMVYTLQVRGLKPFTSGYLFLGSCSGFWTWLLFFGDFCALCLSRLARFLQISRTYTMSTCLLIYEG